MSCFLFINRPLDKISPNEICSPYAKSLARDGVAQSVALLKNENKALPLSNPASVAVIGPNAFLSRSIAGYYGPPFVCDDRFWTVADAVSEFVSDTRPLLGVPSVTSSDTSGIAAAVALAGSVERVVLVVGTDLPLARV
jgi:beta-glucosidase-like glycosyl hydrolase